MVKNNNLLYSNSLLQSLNTDICHKDLWKQQRTPRKTKKHRKNKVILILKRMTWKDYEHWKLTNMVNSDIKIQQKEFKLT